MKVLFLDIDGVLNNFHQRNFGTTFSKPACDNLSDILAKVPDLKIVISSAWRTWGLKYMQDTLKQNGIDGSRAVGVTGKENGCRGYQIQCWLDRNPGVTHMAIVDDESDMDKLMNKLVKTNSFVGLTATDADRIVDMLKNPI